VKRISLILAAALAVAALTASAGAAAPSGVRVIEAKGPAFPVRTFVLSLPSDRQLTAADVHVTENGGAVVGSTLVPASHASKAAFGTVLLLDTSYSMNGKPMAAALAAERAFATHRNPNEQLGAIDFNRNTKVVLPLTTSGTDISQALSAKPQITTGTRIYDAVAKAETMLEDANVNSGSIVVLSDGADTGSTKTLDQVAKAARNAHMRIFTVGLADQTYKPGTLKALAAAGQGEYAQAQAKDLEPLFAQLGQQLSNEYLLQYKSLAGPDKPVHVQVQVEGTGSASTDYRTPTLPVESVTAKPYSPSVGSRVWTSPITMIVLALLVAAVIALLVFALLQPRRSNLPERMSEFVSIRGLQRDKGEAPEETETEHSTWWTRFERTLEIAEIHVEPEMIVAGTIALTGLAFLLVYAATGSPWWSLLALTIPYFVREWVLRTLARRRNRFAEQLPDALQVIASALRSGHSFAGALAVVVESA
jgi:tight adherence protein B